MILEKARRVHFLPGPIGEDQVLTEEEEKEMLKAPGQLFFTLYPGSHPKVKVEEVINTP